MLNYSSALSNRFYVKKEDVYSKVIYLNKFRGILAFGLAIGILVLSMYLVPHVTDLYKDFQIPTPPQTQYALYVMLAISIALSILGVQSIFRTPNKKEIEEKLTKYKVGQIVNLKEFDDPRFNLFFPLLVVLFTACFSLSIIMPIYEISASFEHSDLGTSRRDHDTNGWNNQQIGDSNFYVNYPTTAMMTNEDGCLTIKYGLAYLAILSPKSDNMACLQTGMGAYSQYSDVSEKVLVDETEYVFAGKYVNNLKDPYAEGINGEFYRNEQGIFGNGYKIEYGGSFKLTEFEQYRKDQNVILNVLESANRVEEESAK